MSITSRIKEATVALVGPTRPAVVRSSESYLPVGMNQEPDAALWEPFTIRGGLRRTVRNLPDMERRRFLDVSHHLFRGNPLAKRMTDIIAEYVIGDGIGYVAEDKQVRLILDAHWSNPTNRWSIWQFDRIRDLGLDGELCLTAHINEVNGHVTLGKIDSSMIEYVVDHKDNQMKPAAVVLRKLRGETYRRAYKIIDIADNPSGQATGRLVGIPETDEQKEEFGFPFKLGDEVAPSQFVMNSSIKSTWAGSCFFFTVNNPLSANRGWSDLMPNMDWIDAHDQFLFSQVEKAIESAKYVWDILMKGATPQQMREWLAEQTPMKPGERQVHNESIEQKVLNPDLHLEDASQLANTIKNHILGGAGFPPIWFAESLTSRASAPEMTEPAFKHIKTRQRMYAYIVSFIFRFVIDQAILHSRLKSDGRISDNTRAGIESTAFYLRMPDVSAKDQRALAVSLKNVSQALKESVEQGFMEKGTAKRIFQQYLDMSGLDTWRNEPQLRRGQDLVPDPNLTTSVLFQRASEGFQEVSLGGQTFYLSADPNVSFGTRAAESFMAKNQKELATTKNGEKEVSVS